MEPENSENTKPSDDMLQINRNQNNQAQIQEYLEETKKNLSPNRETSKNEGNELDLKAAGDGERMCDTDEDEEGNDEEVEEVKTYDSHLDKERYNKVLSLNHLESEMQRIILEVKEILDVSPGIAQNLLQKFRWNKELLLEKFYATENSNQFFIDQNVIPSDVLIPEEEIIECGICFDDSSALNSLSCNHQYCFGCWNSYLTEKIVDGGESEITCMAPECTLLFKQEEIIFYINDPAVIDMYRRSVINNYVDTNRLLKWCHGVDCDKALKVTHTSTRHVACTCGSQFCFSCNKDSHEPVNCHLLNVWLKGDDKESCKWILTNTKECPKCNAPIEKNGGCMHMTCRSCKYEFCWLCMKNWIGHQQAVCNTFQQSADSAREKTRANIERHAFYNSRYLAHQQSLQLETNLRESVKSKQETLQEFLGISSSEVNFLQKGLNVLSECRRTLMFSYVVAFYLEPNLSSSVIFETNQQDLQSATEQLSEILERNLEEDDVETLKQRVQDKYRYVESRRQCLLDHCAEGEEQDSWAFNE